MDLIDQTGFSSRLYRGVIDEERLFASLVVKTVWAVTDGRIALAPTAVQQEWAVLDAPKPTPAGLVSSDQCFYKAGADVFLIGEAQSAEPVTQMDVRIAIGADFNAGVQVIGQRSWRKPLLRSLEMSAPEPFTRMPLTLKQAFGGKPVWDELPIPYPDNPDGVGYYLDAKSADGQPLPTIEDPAHRITRWDDRPEPVGLGLRPPAFGPHLRRSTEHNAKGELVKLDPLFFNAAFPACVARALAPGQTVRVDGVLPTGPWTFALPTCPVRATASFGAKHNDLAMRYDQVWLEPASGTVRIAWRSPFRYQLRALEKRIIQLDRVDGATLPTTADPVAVGGGR
jgi:hypothetical protein